MIYPLIKNILCHIMPWILISGGLVLLGLGIRQYKQSKKSKPFLVGLVFILPFVLFAVLTLPFLLLYSHHTVSSTDTDGNGYLFFTRVILSARNSYLISVIATLIALFFGIILGLATVSDKKNIDRLVIFLIQIIETVPRLFLLIIVLALLDSWIGSVASMKTELIVPILGLCIGATCIPKISRFIRQKAKTVYATDFVDASKAHGVSSRRILLYHFLWKNCLNDLIIQATYLLGFCLLVETSLGYLFEIGFGSLGGGEYISLGRMIAEDRGAVLSLKNLWIPAIPGALVSFTILGFYLIGDSLSKWQRRTQTDESFADAIHHQQKFIPLVDNRPLLLLNVQSLSVCNGENQILNEVCFQIEQGKSLALVGESGAGKSTVALAIMRLLMGTQWKIKGAIRLNNVELMGKTQEEMSKIRGSQISMVFQEPSRALNPSLTIQAHFSEVLQKRIKSASKEELLQKASGILKAVGLDADKVLNRYPHELSNGEQQRVMIGLALGDSLLFIADEPTSALDAINQSLIIRLLRRLKESGNIKSILLITHNIRVAQEMGIDEIIILKDGRIVKYCPTQYILNSEEEYIKKLIAATEGRQLPSREFTEEEGVILEVKNLTQYYKRREFLRFSKVCAVENVSFTLRVGECLGLVGESNCGKTTVAKAIVRILDNTEGEIIFHNSTRKGTRRINLVRLKPNGTKHDDAKMNLIRQDIQMIFQNPDVTFNPYMTVREVLTETINLYYKKIVPNYNTKRVPNIIKRLLPRVKLPYERLDTYVEELSGGEKQKLSIARALVPRPKLIIADEPFSRLDVILRQEILSILRELLDQQVILACLVISHDLSFIAQLCDSIAIMYAGKIVEIGNKEEILSSLVKHPYTDKLLRCAKNFDSSTFTASEEFDDSNVSDSDVACPFYPQCNIESRSELCLKEEPKLKRISDRYHFIACHLLTL